MNNQGINRETWHECCITDNTGTKHFVTNATGFGIQSEIRNLKKHLEQSKRYPHLYKFLDIQSAKILLDDEEYLNPKGLTIEDILKQLEGIDNNE